MSNATCLYLGIVAGIVFGCWIILSERRLESEKSAEERLHVVEEPLLEPEEQLTPTDLKRLDRWFNR